MSNDEKMEVIESALEWLNERLESGLSQEEKGAFHALSWIVDGCERDCFPYLD